MLQVGLYELGDEVKSCSYMHLHVQVSDVNPVSMIVTIMASAASHTHLRKTYPAARRTTLLSKVVYHASESIVKEVPKRADALQISHRACAPYASCRMRRLDNLATHSNIVAVIS